MVLMASASVSAALAGTSRLLEKNRLRLSLSKIGSARLCLPGVDVDRERVFHGLGGCDNIRGPQTSTRCR